MKYHLTSTCWYLLSKKKLRVLNSTYWVFFTFKMLKFVENETKYDCFNSFSFENIFLMHVNVTVLTVFILTICVNIYTVFITVYSVTLGLFISLFLLSWNILDLNKSTHRELRYSRFTFVFISFFGFWMFCRYLPIVFLCQKTLCRPIRQNSKVI